MPVSVIPQVTPLSQGDIVWPPLLRTIGQATAFIAAADPRWGPQTSTYALWGALVGAGTTNMGRTHNNEVIVGQWAGAVADVANRPMDGFPIYLPLTLQAFAAGFRMPEHLRVWRLQFYVAFSGGSPTEQTGIELIVSAGTVGGWVTSGVNTGAMGIVGDGAGGLVFARKQGAGTWTTTALTWPNAITELVKVEFQLTAADGRGAAGLALYLNDAAVALPATAASWAAGTTLPRYSDGSVVNSNKFVPVVQANDGVGLTLQLGGLRCISGHFNVDGSER